MTELHPHYGGPFIHKSYQVSPYDVMKDIIDTQGGMSGPKVQKIFVKRILEDEDLTHAVVSAFAVNVYSSIIRLMPVSKKETAKRQRAKEEERKTTARRVQEAVIKVKHAMLSTVMESTFGQLAEMAKAAPQLAKISKMGRPSQLVSNVLSESAVLKILNGK
jgi:hypothetical protein